MKALTLHQPWASLVVVGAKSIETRAWSTKYRGTVAIHAASVLPRLGEYNDWAAFIGGVGAPRYMLGRKSNPAVELPLGAVVASARLVDVVPIITNCSIDMEAPEHICRSGPLLLHHRPESNPFLVPPSGAVAVQQTERTVSDQLPFGDYTHGRFAWLLEDVKPTTERCPWCWGTGWLDDYQRDGCTVCGGSAYRAGAGKCGPVPARGKQGLWEWTI